MILLPISRTPSPQPQENIPQRERTPSFPVNWFFDENAAPPSQKTMESVKAKKPVPKNEGNQLKLSPCVQFYQNIVAKPKEKING